MFLPPAVLLRLVAVGGDVRGGLRGRRGLGFGATLFPLGVPPARLGVLGSRAGGLLAALRRLRRRLRRLSMVLLLLLLVHDVPQQRGNLEVRFAHRRALRRFPSLQRLLRRHRRGWRRLHRRLQVLHELEVRGVFSDGALALVAMLLAPRRLLIGRVLDARAPLLQPLRHGCVFRRRARPLLRRGFAVALRVFRRGLAAVALLGIVPLARAEDPAAERAPKVEQRLLVGELDPRHGRHRQPLLPSPARVVKVPVSTREPLRCESAHEHGLREVRGKVAAHRLGPPGRHRGPLLSAPSSERWE